ncbi:zinc finger CCCH domain-containing protein 15-like isoform X2 [Tachypleus tridentatus]|uniref:zinc finger CCCH domain-containing protein 15-like isoform X2 n=1 Tax=Tachypleus tridentatus TaxID=6853 RepID=UPI003FD6BB18
MENWDEAKLKEVVKKKHGKDDKKNSPTNIICKYFLEALENNKYSWFWDCPNGGDKCHYQHTLPPCFVLNKDKKKNQEKKDDISIEELVEKEAPKWRSRMFADLVRNLILIPVVSRELSSIVLNYKQLNKCINTETNHCQMGEVELRCVTEEWEAFPSRCVDVLNFII